MIRTARWKQNTQGRCHVSRVKLTLSVAIAHQRLSQTRDSRDPNPTTLPQPPIPIDAASSQSGKEHVSSKRARNQAQFCLSVHLQRQDAAEKWQAAVVKGRSIQRVDDPEEIGTIVLRELGLLGEEAMTRKEALQGLLHQPARRQVSTRDKIISAFEPDGISVSSLPQLVPHQHFTREIG